MIAEVGITGHYAPSCRKLDHNDLQMRVAFCLLVQRGARRVIDGKYPRNEALLLRSPVPRAAFDEIEWIQEIGRASSTTWLITPVDKITTTFDVQFQKAKEQAQCHVARARYDRREQSDFALSEKRHTAVAVQCCRLAPQRGDVVALPMDVSGREIALRRSATYDPTLHALIF